jgi:hypothetical protein
MLLNIIMPYSILCSVMRVSTACLCVVVHVVFIVGQANFFALDSSYMNASLRQMFEPPFPRDYVALYILQACCDQGNNLGL